MINNEQIRDFLQNKNFVMFFTSIVFMSGILACFYGFGILFASFFTLVLIVFLVFDLFSVKRILFLILVFYCGFILTFCKTKNHDELLLIAPMQADFTGRIVSIPNSSDKTRLKFFMDIESANKEPVKGKTLVFLSGESEKLPSLNIGETISLHGDLRKPFYSTNPSQFDYSAYLKNFNTFTVLYSDGENCRILKNENAGLKWKVFRYLNATRNKILERHGKYLKSPNLEILGGIVFGDDAVAPPDYIKNSFVNSGLLHILAASGMNVAFIYTFWFFILRFLGVPFKPRVLSGMLVIILYTLMTGLGASVVRAALMLLFVLAGKLIDRDTHSVSLLSLVAVLMLIYNPAYINDVSFQLSFLVTFGLLTTAQIFAEKLSVVPNWIKIPVLVPLVAQIWIAPVQMFYFNTFSLYSIFANITTVSLLSVISFCGFVSSVFAIIPPVADTVCMCFDFFMNYLLNVLVWISDFFANLPHCLVQTRHPDIWQLVLYYSMLLAVTCLIKYNQYKKTLFVILVLGFALICTGIKPVSNELEIIAFDVGNADSFLIKTPQNKYFFVDTGKAPYKSGNSQAKIIMLKYLKDRGIKNLEGIIVTHFDNDHSGGVVDFLQSVNVKTLYLNSMDESTRTAKNIFKVVKDSGQNVEFVKNNSEIYTEPDFKLSVYKACIDGKNKDNDSSTIALLSYKKFDMLFMGDAGVKTFTKIRNYIPHNVEVLKVGHHGGAKVVDKSMLNHLGNTVSLISTGVNYFGHPNQGTLDLLRETNILRTDSLNSIKISSNGNLYKIYSYDIHDKKYKIKENFYSK